ncbi:uncharacterized protein EV422DRAFT_162891 [Fimicolochytrium jonesii]|uniref:uncharacterized protein n=1 Tax=Fimicolochytrium jonesii TaxID=1396493 RepID=UPI0022FEC485|nr:uncharacterized protein EV422DRAFT_162891 [Fimicolochytrium jonesii]KAI8818726.1 hypothetical protein EV422DRAFT_162891 [Fimicolochytrium jonesii]
MFLTRRAQLPVLFVLVLICHLVEALLPDFPDNLVVYPNRDRVSVQGFRKYAGQTAEIRVSRWMKPAGAIIENPDRVLVVVGRARGKISGKTVALEVNHPGGVCWMDVTPDIVSQDVVSIWFNGVEVANGRVLDIYMDEAPVFDPIFGANAITLSGAIARDMHIGSHYEVHIANPDLLPFTGGTDLRASQPANATAGVLTVNQGYSSSLLITGGFLGFVARFIFEDRQAARVALSGGGYYVRGWLATDAAGNPLGITIHEPSQVGGPAMGCPAGPGAYVPPVSTFTATIDTPKGDAKVRANIAWLPVSSPPGADPVVGYDVLAIDKASHAVRGTRVPADADHIAISVHPEKQYTFEVRALVAKSSTAENIRSSAPFPARLEALEVTSTPSNATAGTPTEAQYVTFASNGWNMHYTVREQAKNSSKLPAFTADQKPVFVVNPVLDSKGKVANKSIPYSGERIYINNTVLIEVSTTYGTETIFKAFQFKPAPAVPAPTLASYNPQPAGASLGWFWTPNPLYNQRIQSFIIQEFDDFGGLPIPIGEPYETQSGETTRTVAAMYPLFPRHEKLPGVFCASCHNFAVAAKTTDGWISPWSNTKGAAVPDMVVPLNSEWAGGVLRMDGWCSESDAVITARLEPMASPFGPAAKVANNAWTLRIPVEKQAFKTGNKIVVVSNRGAVYAVQVSGL